MFHTRYRIFYYDQIQEILSSSQENQREVYVEIMRRTDMSFHGVQMWMSRTKLLKEIVQNFPRFLLVGADQTFLILKGRKLLHYFELYDGNNEFLSPEYWKSTITSTTQAYSFGDSFCS